MNFDYRRKVMECVESALKGSFRKEMSLKLNHQAVEDELLNASLASGDDFSVDDLLDFSEMTGADGEECHLDEAPKTCAEPTVPAASVAEHGGGGEMVKPEICRNFSLKEEELVVPADDVADLEWLSHFVEDSFSGYTLTCPPLPAKPVATPPMLPVEASGKPTGVRSKRPRNGVLGWSVSVSETSSSTSSSSSTSFSSSSTWLICTNHFDATPHAAASKKRNSKPPRVGTSLNGNRATTPRRCSHCGVQKTPQWRAGPLGAKTLCNACGVRFKSGRLLPEYRPACSPTFSSELHSNHHRKVLEMRHKKEVDLPETGHAPAVPSF